MVSEWFYLFELERLTVGVDLDRGCIVLCVMVSDDLGEDVEFCRGALLPVVKGQWFRPEIASTARIHMRVE
jgi:hypothetical protein